MGDDAGEERGVLKLQLPPVASCTAAPDAAHGNGHYNGHRDPDVSGAILVKKTG